MEVIQQLKYEYPQLARFCVEKHAPCRSLYLNRSGNIDTYLVECFFSYFGGCIFCKGCRPTWVIVTHYSTLLKRDHWHL